MADIDPIKIDAAVRALAEARDRRSPIERMPDELAPTDHAEAWAIHQAAVAARGPVAGWKVGAASPEAKPGIGQISADTLFRSPVRFDADAFALWAVEAEIAVTFGRDLPARPEPYSEAEVLASISGWSAAIEILDTAFARWREAPALWKAADRQSHGALVVGPAVEGPPPWPLGEAPVTLLIDGAPVFSHRGGNSAGDPTRLIVHLANRQRGTQRPLRRGDVVTTGSTTPFLQARPGQTVTASFEGLRGAELTIGV